MARRFRTDILLPLVFFPSLLSLLAHARPSHSARMELPPPSLFNNIPYWLMARGMQRIIGPTQLALLALNTFLMLLLAWLLFDVGRNLAISRRHPVAGATAGLILFQLCPLVLLLPGAPLIRGWDGGRLLVPVMLLVFIGGMLALAHWSTFMRSIALALIWSVLMGVHPPTAGIVLVAMIPWVLCNRRPLPALGTWLTLALLGSTLFLMAWLTACLVSGYGIWHHGTLLYTEHSWTFIHQAVWQLGWIRAGDLGARLGSLLSGASPSLVLLGFWMAGRSLWFMVRDRRSSVPDVVALLSLAFFATLMLTPLDASGGDWRQLTLVGLWCLLVARELSHQGKLTRNFSSVAILGFLFCAAAGLIHAMDTMGLARFRLSTVAADFGIILASGALSYRLDTTRGMTFSDRFQALLIGSTLGYFMVSDCVIGRLFLR